MYRYFPIIIILFFSSVKAQDCDLSLSGYIIDLHDNSLLKNASIRIENTDKYAVSDEKGYYKIPKVSYRDGVNTVTVSARDFSGHTSTKKYSFNVKLEI